MPCLVLPSAMIDNLHEKLARLLVEYCVEVKPGHVVSIGVDLDALPVARTLVREVLKAEAQPLLNLSYPQDGRDFHELVSDTILDSKPRLWLAVAEQVDASISVYAPSNTLELQGADPARFARIARWIEPARKLRMSKPWVITTFPNAAQAQDAGMSTEEFERFTFEAMHLYDDDPAETWRQQAAQQQRYLERLNRADEVRITGDRTDLRLKVGGRTWLQGDGRKNMPCGEVFTGPVEDSAEGTVYFDVPGRYGGDVSGVTLRFEAGKVVEARAETGDDVLQAQLETDAGARYLGEIGIGTNYGITRPIRNMLYDEKIGGTVHLALGDSYPETGGENRSAIHWDMLKDLRVGGAIHLDGEPFQENGSFLV